MRQEAVHQPIDRYPKIRVRRSSQKIDPRVFDRYHSGSTIGAAIDRAGGDADLSNERTRTPVEAAVLDLIEDQNSGASRDSRESRAEPSRSRS